MDAQVADGDVWTAPMKSFALYEKEAVVQEAVVVVAEHVEDPSMVNGSMSKELVTVHERVPVEADHEAEGESE